ncbi:sugar phosphate isomerase/epimerase family protein [Paenibacillus eucommiae]|uniref:Sugar phosphate isomerase/epimerase n=1 Tax=Paenibacillus eucommiae TaxID=1355755 RepID=A0ABS4ILK8_9BACL|nr:TIM barrel protein [Paenibacillus eucommiae]MBP1988461.1 sugar phosphate isomerase/epimerase [Paenibacillus eucommiae]
MKSGLLSVTFREMSPEQVIQLVSQAGLQGIEWGGDLHVPHGDFKKAAQVGELTREAGIEVASYGSYYHLGLSSPKVAFEDVLGSARALKAPTIRVWAGDRGSDAASPEWRREIAADAIRIGDLAQEHGITIDFEYHGGTLTDCTESTLSLLEEIHHHPNVRCNWQAPVPANVEAAIPSLKAILPWLANVHVYHWIADERRPLSEGKNDWLQYMPLIQQTGRMHYTMLEFVKGDDPGQFFEDAGTLKDILNLANA